MGQTYEEKITRKPQDCDHDLKRVCDSVKFQNDGDKPTLLRDYEIKKDEIILKYEIPG